MECELIKLLVLAANPTDTDPLRLGLEVRMIESRIRSSSGASKFTVRSAWAVTADELMYQLNSFEPNIVHFVGHGNQNGEIFLEGESGQSKPVSPDALARVFASFGRWLQVVVLNACYSATQAQSLSDKVDAVIGMVDSVSDDAAIEFSASFYRALSFGRSVQEAFDQATAALMLHGLPDERIPTLTLRKGVNPASLTLAGATDLAIAVRRAEDPRVPDPLRALLRDGVELILVEDRLVHLDQNHSAEENRIFLMLKMRQSEAVFVVEANRLARVSAAAEYVARRLLPSEAPHYDWTLVRKNKPLAAELSLTMAGLKSGDEVLLTGNHRRPMWSPQLLPHRG